MEIKRKTLQSIVNQVGFIEDQCWNLAEKLAPLALEEQIDFFESLAEQLNRQKSLLLKLFEEKYSL